jgi:hypothetical protein
VQGQAVGGLEEDVFRQKQLRRGVVDEFFLRIEEERRAPCREQNKKP